MKELKVQPIKNGTVIDHIQSGTALRVLSILGISQEPKGPVSVLMNVPSNTEGQKDIVKIENRELKSREVDKIALIAPNATINIIRDSGVVGKHKVKLPKQLRGIVKCSNPNCISNLNEPVETVFDVITNKPLTLRCYYCEREMKRVKDHIL